MEDLTIDELKVKVHDCLKDITSDTFDFERDQLEEAGEPEDY